MKIQVGDVVETGIAGPHMIVTGFDPNAPFLAFCEWFNYQKSGGSIQYTVQKLIFHVDVLGVERSGIPATDIRTGDVVKLTIPSPEMVVTGFVRDRPDLAFCEWFNGDNDNGESWVPCKHVFNVKVLQFAEDL